MKVYFSVLMAVVLMACGGPSVPDVSKVPVELKLVRFERELFSMDTTQLANSIQQLQKKYPGFTQSFLYNIMGLNPQDSSLHSLQQFLHDYKPLFDSTEKTFGSLEDEESDMKQALQFVHHYFPKYNYPKTWYTFIGPMDAYFEAGLGGYGDALMEEGMASGLQLHLGSEFSFYQSEMGQALYPNYISRKFTRETLVVNNVKNMVDELCGSVRYSSLIDQLVDKGRRLYLLDQLMPYAEDTIKIGYTKQQLQGCLDNEGRIWNYFVTNNLLLQTDPTIIKDYLGDAPKTPALGDASPGYIGLFVGRQLVRKYMEKYPETSLEELVKMDPRKVYEGSKYRPK
jgi:hypothetical protein